MYLIEVNDTVSKKEFHNVIRKIYRKDPHFICPLDVEIENIFDPNENSSFKHGEAIRYVLKDQDDRLIGRIAVFINYEKKDISGLQTGGIGFFECVNNQDAANLMLDTAKAWLQDRGAACMDGIINFGENLTYWGVLAEGYMQQGYGMQYHKPYYTKLLEGYGFKNYFEQFSYHKDLEKPWPPRMVKFAEYIQNRPGYSYEHFAVDQAEKYIKDLMHVFNTTWSDYMEGFKPISYDEIFKIFDDAKDIIDPEQVWFAYFKGEPVGIVVAFPDVNQILKHLNGKLSFINKLRFLWHKKRKTITRTRVLLAGVTPKFQNSGVISTLFLQFVRALEKKKHIKEVELSWVGDFNARMRKIYEQIGGVQMKKHITYRYLFDRKADFKRFTNEDGNSQLRRDAREVKK